MLFNSYEFLFLFFPLILLVFYGLIGLRLGKLAIWAMTLASVVFYCWWRLTDLPILLFSIAWNFGMGLLITKAHHKQKPDHAKTWLKVGVILDLLLLGYFKYATFTVGAVKPLFASSWEAAFHFPYPSPDIILPLGISFFTFTQIAYLVDTYKQESDEPDIGKYGLFVTYFPHLIAGPILHHKQMIPQFNLTYLKETWQAKGYENFYRGLAMFILGLFKKVIIADTLAQIAIRGFDKTPKLYFVEAWIASLAYTFQLYFDFSAYSEMAVGIGLMMQIQLPHNFNCPYIATSIQDFWRRWHISLSTFLRQYLYIPLGGNRGQEWTIYRNLFLTFLIGGLWHGAGWMFIAWGALHGLGSCIHRLWQTLVNKPLPTWAARILTFLFIHITWVFFRSETDRQALKVLKGMLGVKGWMRPGAPVFDVNTYLLDPFRIHIGVPFLEEDIFAIILIAGALILTLWMTIRNAEECVNTLRPGTWQIPVLCGLFLWVLLKMNESAEFLYFNF